MFKQKLLLKRISLVNLSEDKDQFLAVQKDASNPNSPNYDCAKCMALE